MLKLRSNAPVASGAKRRGQASNIGQAPTGPAMRRQGKRPQSRPQKSLQSLQAPMVWSDEMAYAAMMADPLNAPTVGKPDFNAVPTNVAPLKDVYTATSTANGEFFAVFQPTIGSSNYLAPTITAGAVTAFGTGVSSQFSADITANNASYRVLAYVVQWQPTLSAMNASGRLFIGQYSVGAASNVPLQSLSSYFDDDGLTATATDPAVAISRHTGDLQFRSISGSDLDNYANTTTAVCITGLPKVAQDVGQIIVTRIVELVPLGTTLAREQARHTPCNMTDCCIAANIVGQAATRGSGPDAYSKIVAAATKMVRLAYRAYAGHASGGWSELARLIA